MPIYIYIYIYKILNTYDRWVWSGFIGLGTEKVADSRENDNEYSILIIKANQMHYLSSLF